MSDNSAKIYEVIIIFGYMKLNKKLMNPPINDSWLNTRHVRYRNCSHVHMQSDEHGVARQISFTVNDGTPIARTYVYNLANLAGFSIKEIGISREDEYDEDK